MRLLLIDIIGGVSHPDEQQEFAGYEVRRLVVFDEAM